MNSQKEVSIKPSFFDDPATEGFRFWKKKDPIKNPSDAKLMEGTLFQKSSRTNKWKSRYYILYEDRLAYYKDNKETQEKEEKGYCLVQNMRLELIVDRNESIKTNEPIPEKDNETDTDKASEKESQIDGEQETEKEVANVPTPKKEEEVMKENEARFGLRLVHNKRKFEFFSKSRDAQEIWATWLSKFCILTCYSASFVNIKAIGKGSFARVYLAKRKSDNADFAVKTFAKDLLLSGDKPEVVKASLINEINIMRKLEHENIIRLYNMYESDHHIYLVLELLNGGELFDRIVKKGQYNENDACILMTKLLSALAYMHSKGIIHRDLKPENLILKDAENDWDMKIADFGLATFITEELLFKRCGTPGYVAPEILADEKYDEKVDVFSAGVILYVLLTGGSPFYSESYNEILWKNKNCEINFNFREFGHRISPAAVDLMKKMLTKDPKQRISSQQALQHEWIITGGTIMSPQTNTPIYLLLAQENMRRFQQEHGLNIKGLKGMGQDFLERSVHAPSPLITGKVDSISDAQQLLFNSPEMSIGAALANRQRLANIKSPKGTIVSMTPQPSVNGRFNPALFANPQDVRQVRNMDQYAWMNQNRAGTASNATPGSQRQTVNPEITGKKAQNVQDNLLKYIQFQSPKPQPKYPIYFSTPQTHPQQAQYMYQNPQAQAMPNSQQQQIPYRPQQQQQQYTQQQYQQQQQQQQLQQQRQKKEAEKAKNVKNFLKDLK